MFKNIILLFILLIGISVNASDNFLNTIVLENEGGTNSIILRSDEVTKVSKEIVNPDRIILTLKNINQSQDLSTLYKNLFDVSGLIVENSNNDLKIYIEAPDISKADIVFETPNSAPITVDDTNKSDNLLLLSIFSVFVLLTTIYSAKSIQKDSTQDDINKLIKEREKALYRNFQKEVATLPSMSYKLKSYRKHVLKGETIRSYESRLSKI